MVRVHSGLVRFPSLCPMCLRKDDLTNYTLKWNKRYREKGVLEVTEKAQVNVPICKNCKDTLTRKARKENALFFAILAPIFWGGLYALLLFANAASWTGFGILLLFFMAFIPAVFLWVTIEPSSTVKWPIKFADMNTLQFENGQYAILFRAANIS
jgi:hypothetical protein